MVEDIVRKSVIKFEEGFKKWGIFEKVEKGREYILERVGSIRIDRVVDV